MYRTGQIYKIELKKGIFYTGHVLEEDTRQIRVLTTRNEELVLNKDEIRQSILVQNSTGDVNEKQHG